MLKYNFAGPVAIPFIGSVIQVAWADHKRPYIALQKLAKKYGNVMSIQLGSVQAGKVPVVVPRSVALQCALRCC